MKGQRGIGRLSRIAILIVLTCIAIVSFARPISRTAIATVEAISAGVYWDASCTTQVQSIDWGNLTCGSSKSVVIYARNEGDKAVILSLSTTDWTPAEASNYMTLSWNYSRQIIEPMDVIPINLKLSVSPMITGIETFSFNIIISSSEATLNVMVNIDITTDQENYVVADILLVSTETLKGGLGAYVITFSISDNITVLNILGGEAPFNTPPDMRRIDGQIVLAAATQNSQGPQMNGLKIARLRLRLNTIASVEQILKPINLTAIDALSKKEYNTTIIGSPLKFMRGDANKDGKVSIADAMFITQYLAGSRPRTDLNLLNAASVKQDGENGDKVTIADAMLIAQYLAGLRDEGFNLIKQG
jgi:hypothetical protein